ncbi:MAG TPA: phosphatase PAP2 family protein [Thermoanaerobaculia bacterium]|nr:phosphatase PAP2 family protein [Thermoanaerobaculia bacterium]
MNGDLARRRHLAAAAFVVLLLLSVLWPSPVVSANRLWLHQPVDVDELSFLGREAPQWDVVFWFFAGVLLLAVLQSASLDANPREPLTQLRALRFERTLWRDAVIGLAAGIALTATAWLVFDSPVLAWAERIQSETTEDVIRLLNRLGGGMNPVMIVAFFLVAGIAYLERRWVGYAISMAIAGLGAGIAAQIIKHLVGRARPELWLGPSHYAPGSSTSFPSGHTVGAFALAGVLVFGSRSWTLRVIAFALAAGVGLSRILAFRHWTSDVTASAVVGLVTAWIVTRVVLRDPAHKTS